MHTDAQTDKTHKLTHMQTDTQTNAGWHTDRCRLTHRQTKGIHAITNGSTGKGTVVMTTMQAGCVIFIINGTLVCEAKEFVISLYGRKNTQKKNPIKKQGNNNQKQYLLKTSTSKPLFRYIYTYSFRTLLKLEEKKLKRNISSSLFSRLLRKSN